jgi:hypothetical protein
VVAPAAGRPERQALGACRGGLYVGGHFGRFAGLERSAVVHLRPDGPVDPAFRVGFEGSVHALELAGDELWVGGLLDHHRGLGHLTANGQPAANVPEVAGDVKALALRDGVLYLAGDIVSVAGRPRDGLAAIRAGTGAVTAFDPRPGTGGPAALATLPRGGLLAGGAFENTEQRATSVLARFGR